MYGCDKNLFQVACYTLGYSESFNFIPRVIERRKEGMILHLFRDFLKIHN